MTFSFHIASTPDIVFGSGKLSVLPSIIKRYGTRVVLLTGKSSLISSPHWVKLAIDFEEHDLHVFHFTISGEPTPKMIDDITFEIQIADVDVVVAIGGGSVLDTGKAVAAMIGKNETVKNFLEGVGTKIPDGTSLPFIAIPTTSGTGSECTKNAVITEIGERGFKKSLRHDNFVPKVALVDPEMTLSCSPSISAMVGMDAFTQLLESYISIKSNPLIDVIALSGLEKISTSFEQMMEHPDDIFAREGMSYTSMLGGIALANAGLGTVHGFASSLGGRYDIPHGVICSKLMAPCNQKTVEKLRKGRSNQGALAKYATVGKLFTKEKNKSDDHYIDFLLHTIERYDATYCTYQIKDFGVDDSGLKGIAENTDNKNNPVKLTTSELTEILEGLLGG